MNIAFITCFDKTIFFKLIADSLQEKGYNVFWISTSEKWTDWLLKQGTNKNDILSLKRTESTQEKVHLFDKNIVTEIENVCKIRVKNIFYMDRVISKWKWDSAYSYICYIINKINQFLLKSKIQVVFGEATALHEVITSIICKYNGLHFLCPHTVRIPSERFVFFKGYMQSEFFQYKETVETEDLNYAMSIRNKLINEGVKPNYWHWSNKTPKVDLSLLEKVYSKTIEAFKEAKSDATVKSFSYHLKYEKEYLKPFRHLFTNFLSIFENPNLDEKFVLYTLHKQPEASIDVLGDKYSNQIELIKSIARILPHDINLYVKEHSNCLGERSLGYLKSIKRIPGVRLIDPFYNTQELIRKSQLVLTVSGTVAFEAGLQGRKSVTFSKVFFNNLSLVKHIESVDINEFLKFNITNYDFNKSDLNEYALMVSNSFEGIISDPVSAPHCIEQENIRNVVNGFSRVLSFLANNSHLMVVSQ